MAGGRNHSISSSQSPTREAGRDGLPYSTGEPIHYVSSTIVPSDESFYCVIEAATKKDVRGAYARAGVPFERMSAAILMEA